MNRLLRAFTSLVAVLAVLGAPGLGASAKGSGPEPVPAEIAVPDSTDQLIVKYRTEKAASQAATASETAATSAIAGEPLSFGRAMDATTVIYRLGSRTALAKVEAMAKRIALSPAVEYAEPDQIMVSTAVPNDPSYAGTQWDIQAPGGGVYGANLPGAWDITTGSASVYVAVVDTGIRPHAELSGRYVGGYDFIADTQVANDGNGRDSDPSDPGDWITAAENASGYFTGCPVRNSSWHGTHVAGTIGAASNNGTGIAGINWVSKIVPVRVLGKCGGYTSDIVDGMKWAAGLSVSGVPANPYPAKVMNLSLGGSGACSSTYQNAINSITAAGAVVVVAAGNSNADASAYSPASCTNVITVASTGKAGNRAYYSNYGATVEIAAPGGDKNADGSSGTIYSTLNAGTTTPGADSYAYYQGTSMATPHVVGVVSLMFSVKPTLTPAQVTSIIQSTATAFPAGSTCTTALCGAGIVNAAAAVAAASGSSGGGGSATFANAASATIPTLGAASPYPSGIVVSGVSGTVSKVVVRLKGLTHTYPDDLDVLLVGPAGQKVLLMSDAGGSADVNGITLTFDDAGAAMPNSGQLATSVYKPTNFGTGDTFPSPAPAGGTSSALSVFNGTNPNGTWSLYVVDDSSSDGGSLSQGWEVTITTTGLAQTTFSSEDAASDRIEVDEALEK